jgi:ABC-type transporter Mla subunit MlaD
MPTPNLATVLTNFKSYLEAEIQNSGATDQPQGKLVQDLKAVNELLSGASSGGATQGQVQAAIEAAANLGTIISALNSIFLAVDGIEPVIGSLQISSDSINLNTDTLEAKSDSLIQALGAKTDPTAATATATASLIAFIKFIAANTDGIESLLGNLSADTTAIKGFVDQVETLLITSNTQTDGIEPALTQIYQAVDQLEPKSDALIQGLGAIADTPASNASANASLIALIKFVAANTDGIETLLGNLSTDTTAIKGFVDGIEALLTTLNTQTDGIEGSLTQIFQAVDQLEPKSDSLIQGLGTTADAPAATGSANASAIALIKLIANKLDSVLTSVDGTEPGLASIMSATDGLEGSLGTISDAAVATPTSSGSAIAFLKYLATKILELSQARDATNNFFKTDQGYRKEVSGSGSALNSTPIPPTPCAEFGTVSVQLLGTWAGTITFEGSNDGVNWVPITGSRISDVTTGSTTGFNGLWVFPLQVKFFQVRRSSFTSGTLSAIALFGGQSDNSRNIQISNISTAHSATISVDPVSMGVTAQTVNRVVSDNNAARLIGDRIGRVIVHEGNIPEQEFINSITLTNGSESNFFTGVVPNRFALQDVLVTNFSATDAVVAFRQTTGGTPAFYINCKAGTSFFVGLSGWLQSTQGTNWTAQVTSANPNCNISAKCYRINY